MNSQDTKCPVYLLAAKVAEPFEKVSCAIIPTSALASFCWSWSICRVGEWWERYKVARSVQTSLSLAGLMWLRHGAGHMIRHCVRSPGYRYILSIEKSFTSAVGLHFTGCQLGQSSPAWLLLPSRTAAHCCQYVQWVRCAGSTGDTYPFWWQGIATAPADLIKCPRLKYACKGFHSRWWIYTNANGFLLWRETHWTISLNAQISVIPCDFQWENTATFSIHPFKKWHHVSNYQYKHEPRLQIQATFPFLHPHLVDEITVVLIYYLNSVQRLR